MVQLQEITEDVATKLKLEAPSQAVVAAPPAVAGPELPPARALTRGLTAEEVLADLNKSPLFMTDLEENDDIAALQALAYEGTPLENARDFKDRGNESFREKQWADAREFYNKGVALLVGEERRRARGEPPAPVEREPVEEGEDELPEISLGGEAAPAAAAAEEPDPDSPEQVAAARAVLEQLYANRAACQLSLRNFRACTLDCGAALRLNPANTKAWYRSGRALLALDKTDEAAAACRGGLATDPNNVALARLADEVATRAEAMAAKAAADAEREARVKRKKARLAAALQTRGIRTRETDKAPEMEDAAMALVEPDDDGALETDVSGSTLVFPAVLLYPRTLQSDFIKAFGEHETLAEHLAYILPPPWDEPGVYSNAAAVDCFMETVTGGLVKVGKKMALGKVLGQAAVEVVDKMVRVYVVPRGESAAWVDEFKKRGGKR